MTKAILIFGSLCLSIVALSLSLPGLVWEVALPETAEDANLQEKASGQIGSNSYVVYEISAHEWMGMEWKNHILILTPREVMTDTILLFITADYRFRERDLIPFTMAANANSARVAMLFDIPNQPLFGGLREDWLISYTFKQFLESGDSEWPALLPMVRSTVAAMNVIEDVMAKEGESVEGFIVSGGSKRGWTTWLSAATDERVLGIIPISYDTLNLKDQMEHQLVAWGDYSRSIREYVETGVLNSLEGEREEVLFRMVDPYTYREDIKVPKIIVVGTNDPYWPADAAELYFHGLVGEKGMVYAPNAGHDADISRVLFSIKAMFVALEKEVGFPAISAVYQLNEDSAKHSFSLHLHEDDWELSEIRIYTAHSDSRDMRQARWNSQTLKSAIDVVALDQTERFTAVYFEAVFSLEDARLLFSTPIRVLEPGTVQGRTQQ
ncbi:MAG TPA: hypothetical protein DCE14_05920 [Kosmotogaceae bacterium]|nr:MAG: Uncharacterized protein XE05_1249 [Thermotogales bacterium 46_20]HAA85869.1 hypothetical protein [Kosmotogaceae bacterium]